MCYMCLPVGYFKHTLKKKTPALIVKTEASLKVSPQTEIMFCRAVKFSRQAMKCFIVMDITQGGEVSGAFLSLQDTEEIQTKWKNVRT